MTDMKTPTKLKIGYADYAVTEEPARSMYKIFGKANLDLFEIMLDESMLPPKKATVLLHEVLHCLWEHQGMNQGAWTEERVVDTLAKGLAMVIRDNPGFVEWLAESLEAQ